MRARWAEEAAEKEYLKTYNAHMAKKMAGVDAADEAEYNRVQSVLAERELAAQAGIQSHLMNEHQDGASAPQQESWWDSAWNWAFDNQTELSFGTGIAIGAVAAIGIVAGIVTAPAWLVIGGVALLTAGVITAGTLIVNNHFGLDPSTNLVDNIITGVVPALTLTGAGYLLAAALPLAGTAITNTCANNPTACSYVGPVVDFGEQAILAAQMAYYGLTNDQENLATTTIEWQMELTDGGMPGNTLTHEASEQLSRLSPEALEIVGQYGDDAIPLLLKYGDEAIDLYQAGHLSPSPLSEIIPNEFYDDVTNAFTDNTSVITLDKDLTVYRYWNGDARTEVGNWVTLNSNLTPEQARQILALPNSNSAINVTEFIIPEGTSIVVGQAADQTMSSWAGSYATGGGLQIYLPDISALLDEP